MFADANKKQDQILRVRIITLNTNYTRNTDTVSKVQNAPPPPPPPHFLDFFPVRTSHVSLFILESACYTNMKNCSYLLERGKESNVNKPQGEKNESPECKVVEVPRGGGGGRENSGSIPSQTKFWKYQDNFAISIPNSLIFCNWLTKNSAVRPAIFCGRFNFFLLASDRCTNLSLVVAQ